MQQTQTASSARPRCAAGLAVALTAHDSMRTIGRTLESVAALAERVLVVDSGSTDGTVELCREAGAEVVHRPWAGHVAQKQFALDQCRDARWVLLLDSDESVSAPLAESIRAAATREASGPDGYEINRRLWFLGAPLRHAFQPEWRLRLVRGGRARVAGRPPHDRLEIDGPAGRLVGDLRHDSWRDVEDMLRRQLSYARLSAEQEARGGTLAHLLVSPGAAFLKQYLLRLGLLDGWRGALAATGAAAGALMKHACIMERRRGRAAR